MKIYVISDSHGDFNSIYKILKKASKAPDLLIYLGDGMKEIYDISSIFNIPLIAVRGNNDIDADEPYERIEVIENHRFFITHGHAYKIYKGKELLIRKAKENNCGIALFGHTHVQYLEKIDNITLFNPGAIKYARSGSKKGYGIINIEGTKIKFKHIEINKSIFSKLRNFSF